VYKSGGELEVEALVAGSGDSLTINVAVDGKDFQNLGTLSLDSDTAPTLPVNLPFTLADTFLCRQKYHLEGLGRFRTLQPQIINSNSNTDPIVVYGYTIITYPEPIQTE
jgi:hypothetical protein